MAKSAEQLRQEALRWNARSRIQSTGKTASQTLLEASKRYQARSLGGSEVDIAIRNHLILFANSILEVLAEEERQRQDSLAIVG